MTQLKHSLTKLFFLFLFCLTTESVTATPLDTTEKRMRDVVHREASQQIPTLEKWVNISSGTTNPADVHQFGESLRPKFSALGFSTRWFEEPSAMQRAGTLVAKRSGKKGKHLLLIAHLDTVFAKGSSYRPFVRHGESARGSGVLDDKGGLLVLLSALQALQAVHALDDTTITVALTGDEEDSGKPTTISRKPLLAAAKGMDIALDFEPTLTLETATIARRGISQWVVTSQGNESHSATIFQKNVGAGALFELARILNALRTELRHLPMTTVNPGIVVGGTQFHYDAKKATADAFGKQNVVAKMAMASGDMRYLTLAQKQMLKKKMQAIVQQSLAGTHSRITFQDGIPPMPPTAQNRQLLEEYSRVSLALGQGAVTPVPPSIRGAGDISYVAAIVPANLAGLGPSGSGTHTVIENIELKTLTTQTERAAILIYRLTR